MRLELLNLTVGYREHAVLRDINLEAPQGSLCALLGPNGCGKTTLLRNINAVMKPLSGKILFEGAEVQLMPRREIALSMALVPQSTGLPFNYSGVDMVVMGKTPHISIWSSPGPCAVEEARQVMISLGVEYLAEKYYMQMSAGERQLVLLARAVMQNAPLFLLDEPTSHLDLSNQLLIMETIRQVVREKGATALIAMHDPNLALRYCDYATLLSEGVMVNHGPADEILTGENLSRMYGVEVKCELTVSGQKVILPAGSRAQSRV